ncbi:Fic family protein [Woodsholea maritima]|uniref:Fic family protein n=1 Tax=Woodsholea maritima TaxID=240237 RepID=UPI00039A8BBF|nr:Fic family protein [Woodsholea maritima]
MRLYPPPPDPYKIIQENFAKSPEKMNEFLSMTIDSDNGSYLHWEDLKRRQPPTGMTIQEYWAALRIARHGASRSISLYQKNSDPFSFTEPSFVRSALSNIDKDACGTLAIESDVLSRQDSNIYLARSIIEEPFSSSAMEGAATTREVAKELIEKNKTPRTNDERMVLNNYLALRLIKNRINEPLTIDLILDIHRVVTQGTLRNPGKCGALRDEIDNITVSDEISGDIYHIPPCASELPERLNKLCEFANQNVDEKNFIHPIIKSIILHFMIGYDHPFVDGNGRTARALFYWSALKHKYWLLEYVSISKILKEAPIKYAKSYIETESDRGDLTYFIIYQLKMVLQSIDSLKSYIESQRIKLNQFNYIINDSSLNHRQSSLLNDIAKNRIQSITVNEHKNIHNVVYITARTDLEKLVELNFLKKHKSGKTNYYRATQNLLDKVSSETKSFM